MVFEGDNMKFNEKHIIAGNISKTTEDLAKIVEKMLSQTINFIPAQAYTDKTIVLETEKIEQGSLFGLNSKSTETIKKFTDAVNDICSFEKTEDILKALEQRYAGSAVCLAVFYSALAPDKYRFIFTEKAKGKDALILNIINKVEEKIEQTILNQKGGGIYLIDLKQPQSQSLIIVSLDKSLKKEYKLDGYLVLLNEKENFDPMDFWLATFAAARIAEINMFAQAKNQNTLAGWIEQIRR